MVKRIYLSPPHMAGSELEYVKDAFDKNWVAPLGENVDQFEYAIEQYLDIGHAVALSSGTAALHLALINLGVGTGDEVIVPSLTFCASVNPIIYQSAIPIFVDSEEETWNMDPQLLEEVIADRIQKGKKPKALILVHLYGMPAKINDIKHIAQKYEIPVIEDAAEALGSRYQDRALGTFGDIGVLSFNGNKIITTSSGGALVTAEKEIAENTLYLSTQARDDVPYYQHSEIGYNYRMSNILAGIGRGQMETLDQRIKQRRKNFEFYLEEFGKYDFINFLCEPEGAFSNYWIATMLFDTGQLNPNMVRLELENANIEARHIWKPMHLQPIFKDYPAYLNGVAENIFNKGLCLPSGSGMTDEDRYRISKTLHNVFEKVIS